MEGAVLHPAAEDQMIPTYSRRTVLALLAAGGLRSPARAFTQRPDIAIGGVNGLESLIDPTATAELRASGRVCLYIHDYIWERLTPEVRRAIVHALQECGPPWVEVGETGNGRRYWDNHFRGYREAGLAPTQAHVNLVGGEAGNFVGGQVGLALPQWKSFVDAAREYNISIVSPIFSPNHREWQRSVFSDESWQALRQKALYGGGITVDTPSWYFLSHPTAYQDFVKQEMAWAKSVGIRSTWIISPPRISRGDFTRSTQQMIESLIDQNALPDQFIVENYMSHPPPDFPFVVGRETVPDTIASVALWMVKHIPRR